MDRNTSTTLGSKCVPAPAFISSMAFSLGQGGLYGLSLVRASHTSTTANILAASGI